MPLRVRAAFVVLALTFFLSLTAVGCGIKENRERIDEITKVADAVCNLRADQIRRIRNTERFLEEHPEGIPGISPELLLQDLAERRKVVVALDPLKCPPSE